MKKRISWRVLLFGGLATVLAMMASSVSAVVYDLSPTNILVKGGANVQGTLDVTGAIAFASGLDVLGGIINLNVSSNYAVNVNTGTSTGTVTIGGGSAPLVINSTALDVTSAGAVSGATTLSFSGGITSSKAGGSKAATDHSFAGWIHTVGLDSSSTVDLDDGTGASPNLIFTDATDETATFGKADSGYLGLTTLAADGLNIITGNLKVGSGVPDQAANGEDAYFSDGLEVDKLAYFDGSVTLGNAAADSITVTGLVASDVVSTATIAGGWDLYPTQAASATAGSTMDLVSGQGGPAAVGGDGQNGGNITATGGAGTALNGAGVNDGDGGNVVLQGGARGGATGTAVHGSVLIGSPTIGSAKTTDLLAVAGGLEVDGAIKADGSATIGDAITDGLTITAAIQGAEAFSLDGLTDNTNEIHFLVTDPGGDFNITVPAITGTLVTTGDTGTVTGTMVLDDTVALTTDTSGNYVANTATSVLTGLTGGSAGSEAASLSLAFDYSQTIGADPALGVNAGVFGTNGIILEGATADGIEGFLTLVDPTAADKTWTLPNTTGTLITTGDTGTVDGTMILNDTVALTTDTSGNYVANAATSVLTGLTGGSAGSEAASLALAFDYSQTVGADPALGANAVVFGTNGLIFEGATANGIEGFLTVTDPAAADKTWTFPNVTGTIVTTGDTGSVDGTMILNDTVALTTDTSGNYVANTATSVLTGLTGGSAGSEGAALSLAFDYSQTVGADPALGANAAVYGTNGIILEGATADGIETFLTLTDPTAADKTITLPNATGTVAVSATSPATLSALGDIGIGADTINGTQLADTITLDAVLTLQDNDVSLTDDKTGGNAGANNEFIGLPRIKIAGMGVGTNGAAAGKTLILMDDTPSGEWTAHDVDTTSSDNAVTYRVDSNSLSILFSVAADAGDGAHDGVAYDFTGDESVGMWIYVVDTTLALGDVVFDMTDNGGAQVVNVPAVATQNKWTWIELDISGIADLSKDVISDISLELSAAGAAKAALGAFTVLFDFGVKWDATEEESLDGESIVLNGVRSVTDVVGGTNAAEWTDWFVNYQAGADVLVWITNLSAANNIALIAYQ